MTVRRTKLGQQGRGQVNEGNPGNLKAQPLVGANGIVSEESRGLGTLRTLAGETGKDGETLRHESGFPDSGGGPPANPTHPALRHLPIQLSYSSVFLPPFSLLPFHTHSSWIFLKDIFPLIPLWIYYLQ